MEKKPTKPRIRVGRTEMDFPHQGKMLTAVQPFYGPADSKTLQNLIRKEGNIEPTSAQLTSFVHKYLNGNEPRAKEVNQIMKKGYFRGFTGILYLPQEKIAHFIDYPEFNEENVVDRDSLLKRLDESYAQVPFKYIKNGPVDWRKMAKHRYFIAWAGGKEGAEKLSELASKYSNQEADIWVPEVLDLKEPLVRIATLISRRDGSGLGVVSGSYGFDGSSYAFGVLK